MIKHVIILCGGKGTRLGEATGGLIAKPMIDICGKPLHHRVIDSLGHGIEIVVLSTGKDDIQFRRHWNEYHLFADPKWIRFPEREAIRKKPDFDLICHQTGYDSETGYRIYKSLDLINSKFVNDVLITYGDGIGNIDLPALEHRHVSSNKLITMTIVNQPSRFGTIELNPESGLVESFSEKKQQQYINAGYMLVNCQKLVQFLDKFFEGITDDNKSLISFERDILPIIAQQGELNSYYHKDWWQCVDTPRDLEAMRERFLKLERYRK